MWRTCPQHQHAPRQAPRKSAALFEATRDVAATIAEAAPQAQADWLWDNYAEHSGATQLERGNFGGDPP